MAGPLTELLAAADRLAPPAYPADVARLAGIMADPVPHRLAATWAVTGGAVFDRAGVAVVGPSYLLDWHTDSAETLAEFLGRGWVPVVYDGESNYLAVVARGPFAGRVAHVPHDDGPRLMYRDLDGCFADVGRVVRGHAGAKLLVDHLYDTAGDYPAIGRSSDADRAAARLAVARPDDGESWNFAAQLLDADDVAEWRALLETDHFVRRDVLARVRQLAAASPALAALVQADAVAFERFASQMAATLQGAGVPEPDRFLAETFYYRRHVRGCWERLADWVGDVRAAATRGPGRGTSFGTDDGRTVRYDRHALTPEVPAMPDPAAEVADPRVEIQVVPDAADLPRLAADRIVAAAAAKLADNQHTFSIALSGGGTPKRLFELLATDAYRSRLNWCKVEVYWGDERCVPPDHPDSNYRMAHEAMLSHLPIPECNIHRMRGELDPHQAAVEYGQLLKGKFQDGGCDLVLLGMGPDGHTASLFPGTAALDEIKHRCVANHVPQLDTWRLTMTYPFLNRSAAVLVLVEGEKKADRLRQVLEGPPDPHQLPIQGIRPDGVLTWLIDAAAAGMMSE